MELDERVARLEQDMEVLTEIRAMVRTVQSGMSERRGAPVIARWGRRAWVLALLNVLLATALFLNQGFLTGSGQALVAAQPPLANWLRGLWLAIAFVWLIVQMYPLALLLEGEDEELRSIGLRQVGVLFSANPGLALLFALIILAAAVVSTLMPALWFLIVLALLPIAGYLAVRHARG